MQNTGSMPESALLLGKQTDSAFRYAAVVADTKWGQIPGKGKGNECWYPYDWREHTTGRFSWVCDENGKALIRKLLYLDLNIFEE